MAIHIPPSPRHVVARDNIVKGLRDLEDLTPPELLAVAAQVVGQLVALQDQTKYTSAQVMDLVGRNIEEGNRSAIAEIMTPQGSA